MTDRTMLVDGRTTTEHTRTPEDVRRLRNWGLFGLIAFIALVFLAFWVSSRHVDVTIGAGRSVIAELNRINPPTSDKVERKNYLTGIRIAEACGIPVYKSRGIAYRQTALDRITYTEARATAGTTDRFLVAVPVYARDVLSTRGSDRCRAAPNTPPFDRR